MANKDFAKMNGVTRLLFSLSVVSFAIGTSHTASANRIRSSDSILDIINTRHIERVMAERRQNASREEKRSFLAQNDLDEDFGDLDATAAGPDAYQTPEVDFAYNNGGGGGGGGGSVRRSQNKQSPRMPMPPPMDILMAYNDTGIVYGPDDRDHPNPDILADLQAFRSDKLLQSSKNALIVTKKEYLKKDWCKTEPLVQRIREEGCLSRTIINRFCYGQCNSFYIPKSPKRKRPMGAQQQMSAAGAGTGATGAATAAANNNAASRLRADAENFEDEDLTGAAFRSCAFCKPKKFTWITVTLRCPSLVPQLRKKRIQRIKQCKCIAVPAD